MIHAGKFEDIYFILDVESGSLFQVDEIGYEAGRLMEKGEQNIEERLAPRYGAEAAREITEELEELRAQGLLDSPCLADKKAPVFQAPVVKSLCLHIAHDCNLRCSYCFASEGTYMGKRALMSEEVARAALDFLMEQSGGRKHLEVDFFGGEPLINFGVVKEAVRYGRELEKKYGKIIRFTMTTNAYHVTDEMVEFINREMKNLVISIDGRKEIHDAERKNAAGKGSYETVLKNAKRLIAARGDKEYYIRGTYTARNLDFSEDVLSIADNGFDEISLEPVVAEGELALREEHLDQIGREYDKLGKILLERRREGRPFHFFHFMVDFSSGPCLNKRLRGCGAGTEYAAITPEGDIYPCHQFVGIEPLKMGNVLSGQFDKAVGEPFLGCHVYAKPECDACFAKYFCSGGCAANAYKTNGDIMKPHKISCEIQRRRLDTAMGLYIAKKAEEAAAPVDKDASL